MINRNNLIMQMDQSVKKHIIDIGVFTDNLYTGRSRMQSKLDIKQVNNDNYLVGITLTVKKL